MNYQTARWKKKRSKILRADKYVDRYQRRFGRTMEATTVHHIYPAKEYPEYEWEDWNLISVSQETHNQLEDRTSGRLTKAGEELKRRTIPGKDWRNK